MSNETPMTELDSLIHRAIRMTRAGINPAEIVPILVSIRDRLCQLHTVMLELQEISNSLNYQLGNMEQ